MVYTKIFGEAYCDLQKGVYGERSMTDRRYWFAWVKDSNPIEKGIMDDFGNIVETK